MKSLYLFFWALSAIFLAIYGPNFKDIAPVYIFNFCIPIALLVVRIILLHEKNDKDIYI